MASLKGMIPGRIRSWFSKRKLNFASPEARAQAYVGWPHVIAGAERIQLGHGLFIEQYARLEALTRYRGQVYSPRVKIGDRVQILYNFHLGCVNSVEIGDETLIGSFVTVLDHDHGDLGGAWDPRAAPAERALHSKGPVKIGARCWIGEKATILGGVTLGEGAVVAAHALVNKDVAPFTLVGGVPARPLKKWNPSTKLWETI